MNKKRRNDGRINKQKYAEKRSKEEAMLAKSAAAEKAEKK